MPYTFFYIKAGAIFEFAVHHRLRFYYFFNIMSPASCELLHHLQKAWELAHGAPFVEDRLTHEEAATVLGEMQFHLVRNFCFYLLFALQYLSPLIG